MLPSRQSSEPKLSRYTIRPEGLGIQEGKNSGQQTKDSSPRAGLSLLHCPQSRANGQTNIPNAFLTHVFPVQEDTVELRTLLVLLLGSVYQLHCPGPPCVLSSPFHPSVPLHLHSGIFSILTVASTDLTRTPPTISPVMASFSVSAQDLPTRGLLFHCGLRSLTSSRKTSTIASYL